MVIVLKQPRWLLRAASWRSFAKNGGRVGRSGSSGRRQIPNAFALEMRRILGREQRVIDIWNGITVLTAPYQEPDGTSAARDGAQLRIRAAAGSDARPRNVLGPVPVSRGRAALLPYRHRDGYTEFLLPALRIGARVFLSQELQ